MARLIRGGAYNKINILVAVLHKGRRIFEKILSLSRSEIRVSRNLVTLLNQKNNVSLFQGLIGKNHINVELDSKDFRGLGFQSCLDLIFLVGPWTPLSTLYHIGE